jgi:hypothetical protein
MVRIAGFYTIVYSKTYSPMVYFTAHLRFPVPTGPGPLHGRSTMQAGRPCRPNPRVSQKLSAIAKGSPGFSKPALATVKIEKL